jgi:hypothetical protein
MGRARLGRVVGLYIMLVALCAAWGADWPSFKGPTATAPRRRPGCCAPGRRAVRASSGRCGSSRASPGRACGTARSTCSTVSRTAATSCGASRSRTAGSCGRYEYDAPGKVGHNGSRTPPTVDEQYVYTVGMMGHFVCTDRKSHKPVWQKNLLTDFGVDLPSWGRGPVAGRLQEPCHRGAAVAGRVRGGLRQGDGRTRLEERGAGSRGLYSAGRGDARGRGPGSNDRRVEPGANPARGRPPASRSRTARSCGPTTVSSASFRFPSRRRCRRTGSSSPADTGRAPA